MKQQTSHELLDLILEQATAEDREIIHRILWLLVQADQQASKKGVA